MKTQWRVIIGVLLISLGILSLLQSFGYLPGEGLFIPVLFSMMFLTSGGLFLNMFLRNRAQWWPIIPGVVLIDIGVLILGNTFIPGDLDQLGGAFFLAGLGLAFWLVYLSWRENWWGIIPGGVLFTLAVIAGVGENPWVDSGSILFLGLALTFALTALLARMEWAWYPAAALFIIGMLISSVTASSVNLTWPAAMIVVGIILLTRSFLHKAA